MEAFDHRQYSDASQSIVEPEIAQEPVVNTTHLTNNNIKKPKKRLNKNTLLSQFMMFEAGLEEIETFNKVYTYNKHGSANNNFG